MSPVDRMEDQSDRTEGGSPVKPAQEILCARDPVSRGNTAATELISTQPSCAAALPAEASQVVPGHRPAQKGLDEPTCPRCGLRIPDHTVPPRSPSRSRLQGCSASVHSSSSSSSSSRRSRSSGAAPAQPATTQADSCFRLLLACLWCQCSALLLGLLEACSCCLHALCPSCCHACARCCAAVQQTPVEELGCHAHCHSVLFQSCCEPTECLEFCLECCEICHRS